MTNICDQEVLQNNIIGLFIYLFIC